MNIASTKGHQKRCTIHTSNSAVWLNVLPQIGEAIVASYCSVESIGSFPWSTRGVGSLTMVHYRQLAHHKKISPKVSC